MRRAIETLVLAVAVLSFDGCKPKAADTCSGSDETCADEKTKLVCRHDRYMPVACEGPKGCKVDGNKAKCDFSGNKVGSPCDDTMIGLRQCKDGKSVTTCRDGRIAVFACGGPGGCTSEGTDADAKVKECDTSVAKEGDECDRSFMTKPACDKDGKKTLECGKDGKLSFSKHCRGPKGCTSEKGAAVCDGSVQQVGDPCTPPGEWCSADGVGILLCDGHNIFEKMCLGPGGCKNDAKGISCDELTAHAGSGCTEKGWQACEKATDKEPAKLLECDGKTFKQLKKCPASCTFTRPKGYDCK